MSALLFVLAWPLAIVCPLLQKWKLLVGCIFFISWQFLLWHVTFSEMRSPNWAAAQETRWSQRSYHCPAFSSFFCLSFVACG